MTEKKNKDFMRLLDARSGSGMTSARGESGRSMVEMLGVLAVVGVLSVGGIAGYTYAMNKYHADEIIDGVSKMAVIASQQLVYKDTISLKSEFGNEVAGYPFQEEPEGSVGNLFYITVSNIPAGVCEQVADSDWTMPYSIMVNDIVEGNCSEEENAITFAFTRTLDNDMESTVLDQSDCADVGKIWSNGSCMDACPTGYTACGSACCADGSGCVDGKCVGCVKVPNEWGEMQRSCGDTCAEGDSTYCASFWSESDDDGNWIETCDYYDCCSGKFLAPDMEFDVCGVWDEGHCCESGTPYCISYNCNCVFGYECCPEGKVVLTYDSYPGAGGVHASACCNPGDNVYCTETHASYTGYCQFASCCPAGYKYENGEIYGGKGACCKPEQEMYCETMLATYEQAESWINSYFPDEGYAYYPEDYVGICAWKECCDPGKYVEATATNNGICCDGKESTWGINGTGEPYVEWEYDDGYKQYNCCNGTPYLIYDEDGVKLYGCCNGTVIKGENGQPDTCQW